MNFKPTWLFFFLWAIPLCTDAQDVSIGKESVSLIVLGNVQDAGSPHIGCAKSCCELLFVENDQSRKVVSLGLIDPINNKTFLFEATPDMPSQLKMLKNWAESATETPDGIFLTHAHMGHYSGLMYLGREALGAERLPVYAMPKMKGFLENNGPWSQLVALQNISIIPIENNSKIHLTDKVAVVPFTVPHRDEFSETVGYKIIGPKKSVLFIPDIDKWSKWTKNIVAEIAKVDYAFLDATFFDGDEINNRDSAEIPHPFVVESMALFDNLPSEERNKIYFIHLNHTNPLLNVNSEQIRHVLQQGFRIARIKDSFKL